MQEFYERLIKEELFKYQILKESLPNINNQIEELESKKISKVVATYGTQPMGGGGSSQEDKLLNINAKIDLLRRNREYAIKHIAKVDNALKKLNNMEKDIVLNIHGRRGKRDGVLALLIDRYHYEKSHIYRIADDCLERISFFLYGDA